MDLGLAGRTLRADITDPAGLEPAVATVAERLGPVEVLVNNVGWARRAEFLEQPVPEAFRLIEVNLLGMMNLTRAVPPSMVERGGGAVVSIGSDAGRIGEKQESAYGAAKARVISLTKTLAREYGRRGVPFNVVCPGATVPDRAEDIAGAIVFLTSPQAGFITGQTLSVNGGYTMS